MPFSQSMAEKLRRIWKKEILRDNQEILPSEWSTLNQLAHISDEVFSDLISEGRIHPKLTRSERMKSLKNSWLVRRLQIGTLLNLFAIVICSPKGSFMLKS